MDFDVNFLVIQAAERHTLPYLSTGDNHDYLKGDTGDLWRNLYPAHRSSQRMGAYGHCCGGLPFPIQEPENVDQLPLRRNHSNGISCYNIFAYNTGYRLINVVFSLNIICKFRQK